MSVDEATATQIAAEVEIAIRRVIAQAAQVSREMNARDEARANAQIVRGQIGEYITRSVNVASGEQVMRSR